MHLIELSANKKTFHTVNFNKNGVSFILGKKINPDNKSTFNGVGKTLTMRLVHFCLGSDKIDEFEKKLPDWVFYLKFEIGNSEYLVERSTNSQEKIILNGSEINLTDFRKLMFEWLFVAEKEYKFLTFRSLLPRFLRPRKESYLYFDSYIRGETPYATLLNNSFLLGIDIDLIEEKNKLKSELDKVKEIEKIVEKDEVFKRYFTGDEKISIHIFDLSDRIKKLEKSIAEFNVADDYLQIKFETDEIDRQMKEMGNLEVIIRDDLKEIEKSLSIKSEHSVETIVSLYDQVKVHFSDVVKKRLEDVVEFHENIVINREKRLLEEKKRLLKKLSTTEDKRRKMGIELNENLGYLNSHGALGDFIALNRKLSDMKSQLNKLETYDKLLSEYKLKINEVKAEMESQDRFAEEYIQSAKNVFEGNMALFRSFSEKFYKDKPGGIEVKNNDGLNKTRFNIDVEIWDDASDGINEVKIFCFDLTVLLAQHNHNVNVVFHDSRLFSNMDPRQRMHAFKVAYENTQNSKFQYIATVNEDTLLSFKELMTEVEYKKMISDNIVLELTDESEESKLLGINVNIKEV